MENVNPSRAVPILLTLSVQTGVAPCNCFAKPLCEEDLLDRIGMEHAAKLFAVQKTGNGRLKKKSETSIGGGRPLRLRRGSICGPPTNRLYCASDTALRRHGCSSGSRSYSLAAVNRPRTEAERCKAT